MSDDMRTTKELVRDLGEGFKWVKVASKEDVALLYADHKDALLANREKDAEIARLNQLDAVVLLWRAEKAEAELSSLRAGEKWIEIKEGCEMPKDEVTVLVYAPYWRCLPFSAYVEHGQWHGEGILSLPSNVTHWQPLPAPPTDKES